MHVDTPTLIAAALSISCVGKPRHASELGAVLDRRDAMRRVA